MVNTEGNIIREIVGCDRVRTMSAPVLTMNGFDTMSENFYLSGYEAITINHSKYHSIKTVISSTVSFEDEILLLKVEDESGYEKDICTSLNVSFLEMDFDCTEGSLVNVELLLDTHKDISYVYLELDDLNFSIVNKLNEICEKARVVLIVNLKNYNREKLSECIEFEVPYIIMPDYLIDQSFIVIANRRNLVQTEGVSGTFEYDLYSMWQNNLDKRNTRISPMAV